MRKPILLALLFLIPMRIVAAISQNHPNLETGFSADKMYQFNNVDNVNLFNGNLTFTIPLGGSTVVSDRLATSMTLVYNSKLWDSTPYRDGTMPAGQETRTWKMPTPRSNAGLGWLISFGRMFQGASGTDLNDSDIVLSGDDIHYESPDGADHVIHNTGLHNDNFGGGHYSRDGSYIRMTDGNPRLIETPDGLVREFTSYMDGSRRRWRITKLRDPFGNHIDFDYSTPLQWKITDQYGRISTVHFIDVHTADSAVVSLSPAYLTAVDYVEVPSPAGVFPATARYTFTYQDRWVWTGYCGENDIASKRLGTDTYRVPMLLQVKLPDDSSWNFSYAKGTASNQNDVIDPGDCSGGSLTSAVLPTMGVISWDYMMYEMPTAGCDLDPIGSSAGVKTRTLSDPTTNTSGTWSYSQELTPENDAQWSCAANQFVLFYAPAEESITTVTDPDQNRTKYHFSAWPVSLGPQATRPDGATYREYGLPFSHKSPAAGGKLLSTEVFQHADPAKQEPETIKRTTYVKYEYDPVAVTSNLDSNRSLFQTRTVFNDDSLNYVDVSYSENDGLGHYRTVTTSGTFLGTGNSRTVTTDYNRNSSLVGSNIFETGIYDTANATAFPTPPTSSPWLTNLYSRVVTTEGTSTAAVQEVCFDPATGFLKGTRTYAGSGRTNNDVVAAFGSDTASANGSLGAMTSEKYYGGDVHPLTADAQATLCGLLASPGTLEYDIRHTYDHGVRKTSEYFSGGTTVGFKFLDLDIDPNTGLPSVSRDTAGVATLYSYNDLQRRMTSARTGTDPAINYAYNKAATNGTVTTGANATISQVSTVSGAPQVAFEFDGFGRLVLHSSTLPSTTPGITRWSRQRTIFDGMGRKSMVSEAEESAAPSHFTVFSDFDVFGHARTIQKPDGTKSFAQYTGSRKIDRTAYIHTQQDQPDTAAVTTELYDVHGRLYDVLEPASGLHASYTYDVGNRLNTASITGDGITQTRSFTYDNRGFLISETHPELGPGSTTYDHYDARGHAQHKLTGTANGTYDLQFVYDPSEHLTNVSDQNGARQLKHFVFATQNDTGVSPQSNEKGKLSQAIRTNHLPTGDVVVTETYKYQTPSGRLSSRQTDVTSGTNTLQSYQQAFFYDDIGEITNPGYPTCLNTAPCGTVGPGATFTYKDGSLVTVPGYASNITYLGNMLSQVVHQNGVTDTYTQAATNGLARPFSIGFSNWSTTCPVPAAPVITAAASVPASSTGNVASVPSDGTLLYAWSITGGTITAMTANSITFTAGASGTVALSATAAFASNSCGPGPAGTRNVPIQQQLSAPINFSTTLNGSSSVTLGWAPGASGPSSYRIERKDCFTCSWVAIGPNPTSANSYTDTISSVPGNPPAAHLYHVIAVASGSTDSQPSLPDYAVTASTLFAETIGNQTPIRGAHVQELRRAIDALRALGNLLPYTAGWTDYNAPTGTVLAVHQTDMRTALDQAVFALLTRHVTFTGTTPANGVAISASHLNQLRNTVK